MGPGQGPNEWAQWAWAWGPNEWAQMGRGPGPNEWAHMGPGLSQVDFQDSRSTKYHPTWDWNEGIIIEVRDCPYGICCPWVCGGWGLDALGKFFRRRRRRRPRPLLFRQFLEKVIIFRYFS